MDIKSHRRKRRIEVNIVPMVDVLTVLIFFFLLTMQFKEIYAVDITPPKMESSSNTAQAQTYTIAVTKGGKYFFDNTEVSIDELREKIADVENRADVALVLLADKDTPLQYVTNAIDIIKLSNIKKLSLQTNK